MLSYKDFTKHFGASLLDKGFQSFLSNHFSDLTEYNVREGDYITSEETGLEIGFTNNAAYDDKDNLIFEPGNPIFSHFNIYPKSLKLIDSLPFEVDFSKKRDEVIIKVGPPTKTNEGFADFLNRNFLVDSYKLDNTVITYDYDAESGTINFIQIRDNLVHCLKL